MPRKTFVAGDVLTASQVNTFLMDQSVMTFADSDARDLAIPTPSEGMVTYLDDTDALEVFDGSSFVAVGGGGGGAVLQVVRNSTTTTTTTTSTSMADVTNMNVEITPTSATSNIFVFMSAFVNPFATSGGNIYGRLQITDASNAALSGAGDIFLGNQNFSFSGTGSHFQNAFIVGFVAAVDTSARTYKLRSRVDAATTSFSVNSFGQTGQMIAIEVAA